MPRCLRRLVERFRNVAPGSKARSDLVHPRTFVRVVLHRRSDGCRRCTAAQVKSKRAAIGLRGPLAARAQGFNSDRIPADPLLLALQPVPLELGRGRIRARPSGCAGCQTREHHHRGPCKQGLHRDISVRTHLPSVAARFPAVAAVRWPANARRLQHCLVRFVYYIL